MAGNDEVDPGPTAPVVGERVAAAPAALALPPGTIIAERYRVAERLGAGGMGVVYRAHDERLARDVAIKLLLDESPAGRRRMLREATAMARLSHPNIVAAYDVGEWRQGVFLAMELVAGQTLGGWLAARPRGWREVVAVFLAAGEGLVAMHEAGLWHRDFKPGNVLIDARGRVRVADLGLVRAADAGDPAGTPEDRAAFAHAPTVRPVDSPAQAALETRTGVEIGTPGYMAPEQRGGAGDARSDQYSFCVALFEALHGAPPGAPRRPGVPRWLDRIVARGLSPRPDARFPSMRAILAALAPGRGRRAAVVAAVVLPLVAAGAVAAVGWPRDPPPPAPPRRAAAPPPALPPPAVTRPLTGLGGCAFSPVFADARTVVFDHTLDGRTDLYAVDVAGGAPRLVAGTPTMEWHAARGRRDGEVVYSDSDDSRQGMDATHLVFLDVASGARAALPQLSSSASFGGGWLYYLKMDTSEVRRARDADDEVVVTLPEDHEADSVAAARDGRHLLVHASFRAPQVCLVDTATRDVACLPAPGALIGRGDFTADGRAVYYARATGIHRVDVATREDREVLPGADAPGGLTVAADGHTLVYSRCRPRGALRDLDGAVVVDERPLDPVIGAGGRIAYVRAAPVRGLLVVKEPSGVTRVLTSAALGQAQHPAFDGAGRRVAFAVRGPQPGIYVADAAGTLELVQLTTGASDSFPIWDGEAIYFARTDERRQAAVYRVDAAGGTARRVHPASRRPRARLSSTGELVLVSSDGATLYLWSPGTGKERVLAVPALAEPYIFALRASFDGSFLVADTGAFGQQVWKIPVAAPRRAEKVFEVAQGQGMDGVAVDERGRIYTAPHSWIGELFAVSGSFD